MANQIDFNLPEINREQTKTAEEGALKNTPFIYLWNLTNICLKRPKPPLLFHLLIQINFIHLSKMQQ